MATVNFSVPKEVKVAFNKAFSGENKSAMIARLMHEAVQERERQQRRTLVIDALLKLRSKAPTISTAALRAARLKDRP